MHAPTRAAPTPGAPHGGRLCAPLPVNNSRPYATSELELPTDYLLRRPDVQANCEGLKTFEERVQQRMVDWKNSTYIESNQLWQHTVNHKLIGYLFAHSLGVRTPRLLGCLESRKPQPAYSPSWPDEVVVKPINGWSSRGVTLVSRPSGNWRNVGNDLWHKYPAFIVEERVQRRRLLEAHRGNQNGFLATHAHGRSTTPPDYKFFVMDGKILGFGVVHERFRSECTCVAWFFGSTFQHETRLGCADGCAHNLCPKGVVIQPPQWGSMVAAVERLARALNIFYRIDMFAPSDGSAPMLGEFTPWPATGKCECFVHHAAKYGVATAADHQKPHLPEATRCNLMLTAIWAETGAHEGGQGHEPPQALANWKALSNKSMLEKCRQVRRAQMAPADSSRSY